MNPRILDVKYIDQYRLALTFTNGEKADVDLQERIVGRGGIFKALEDVDFFKQVRVDEEIGTIVWPNEVDFCPDVLYSQAMNQPINEYGADVPKAMAA